MSLEDTLRALEQEPIKRHHPPDSYGTVAPDHDPNWGWSDLWEQSNPRPSSNDDEVFNEWYEQLVKMRNRIWVAYCLPEFRVFDWPDEDVATMRKLVAKHVCGVCGRKDDPGCWLGC